MILVHTQAQQKVEDFKLEGIDVGKMLEDRKRRDQENKLDADKGIQEAKDALKRAEQ